MSIFVILMTENLKKLRLRVQPTMITTTLNLGGNVFQKHDRDMMKILLIELIIYIITIIHSTVMHILQISCYNNIEESKERQLIETFVIYFARTFLLYICNTFSFWVYLSTSYHLEVINMITKYGKLIVCK